MKLIANLLAPLRMGTRRQRRSSAVAVAPLSSRRDDGAGCDGYGG
jgi:hypothetical protein